MTWTHIGTAGSTTAATFTAAPGAIGNLIPIQVICESATVTPSSIASSNATWTKVASATGTGPNAGLNSAWFLGTASSASSATATISFSGTKPTTRAEFDQFHSSVGSWHLDGTPAVLDSAAGTNTWPVVPGSASGSLQLGFAFNNNTAVNGTNGTPAGSVYGQDANGNGYEFNLSQAAAGSAAVWGDSTQAFGIVIALAEGPGTVTVPLAVAQVTAAAPVPGTAAGPVALPVAQVTAAAPLPVPVVSPVLPVAQVNAAGQVPSVVVGPVSVPLAVAQVNAAAPVATGSASVSVSLGVAQVSAAAQPPVPQALVPIPVAQVGVAGHLLAPPASSITVAGTWTGASAVASGFFFPFPSSQPVQIPITNTPGDWVFALVSWRPGTTGSDVSIVVADDAHNWWEPVGAPSADSGAAGVVRTALWAAPAARVANSVTGVTIVQVAATGPVLGLACTIVDMNGLLPWYQVAAITGNFANAASSLSLSAGAPPARALLFAAFGSDDNSKTITGPSGWTALTGASASNGTDHTADIKLTPAYQVVTGSSTASVSSSGSLDLAGVIAGVLVSAAQPAQPNPNWPVMITEVAIGSGVRTPPSEMTWTTLAGRSLGLQIQQGKMYSLGQLQAGQGTITLDDPDGALIPPGTGAYAGIDSGTPLRRRVAWPGFAGVPNPTPHYVAFSGFIRRWPFNLDPAMLRGQVIAEITDAWGYGNGPLNAMAIQECLLDNPHSLWPLTDPPGSTGAGNLVPNGAPLPLVTSKFGAGGAVVTWGANSGALLGMSSAQVTASGVSGGASGMFQQELAGASLATPGFGFALSVSDPAFPPLSGGATIETWCEVGVAAALAGIQGNAEFLIATTGGTFNTAQSNFTNGMPVILGVLGVEPFPAPFTAGTVYFVRDDDGNGNYNLAGSPGGAVITPTSTGATVGTIVPQFPWNPVILAARGINGTVAQLELNKSTGALIIRYRPAGAVIDTLVTADSSRDWRIGFLTHFSLALTRTTWRLMVAGGGLVNATGTFSSALPGTFATACFGGVMDRVTQGDVMPGLLAVPGVYPGFSPQVRVLSRFESALNGMTGEAACDRVERLLEYAGLTGRRWLGRESVTFEGDLLASGQDVGGQAAVSSISNIAQSTLPAYAAVAPTGDILYRSKLYAWNEPVRWTLGDNTAGGEIPFSPGSVATDYDPTRVTAKVQLTQLDTQAVTTPSGVMSSTTMADVAGTAAGQYGGTPYQNTGYLLLDWSSAYNAGSSLQDLANWVQAVYAKPANRIASVLVDASRYPAAWPFWAGAAVGDMVQVNVRLPTAPVSPLISLIARITQTARSSQFSQEATTGSITATLDFAPEYMALTCDDPVRGLLNGSNVLPW